MIDAQVVIESDAVIGAGSHLYAGSYVGKVASMVRDCVLFPNVVLYEGMSLGDRVRVHAGTVIGSDGFGYAPERVGHTVMGHRKIYHLGFVRVGDDVEIGANCTIDRGTIGDTMIGAKVKLDNLVQVGHNARLDEGAVICGGTCLAGSAHIGRFAYIGGLTGVTNHVHVGDGAQVGAVSLVTKDVPAGGTAVGNPQRDYRDHFKAHARLSRLGSERRTKEKV